MNIQHITSFRLPIKTSIINSFRQPEKINPLLLINLYYNNAFKINGGERNGVIFA
ncbi:MAG: hypothetical protein J5680_02795 [Neisseriaceae bacterium]|nr:hypothetical protein [Neisseriaceae bacterium]